VNILLIHHVADLYGSSRSLLRLTSALSRDGHRVHTILQETGPLKQALEAAGAHVIIMPRLPVLHRNKLRSPAAAVQLIGDIKATRTSLMALMRDVGPDLVHTNSATIVPVAGACAKKLGIPHIQHIREFFDEFGIIWTFYRAWLMRYADLILCVSASTTRQFPKGARMAVLHNGFPAGEFSPATEAEIESFRRQFGRHRRPLIGIVGRIKLKRKGQETFVEAAALLKKEFPHAGFLIIGAPFPGNESHELEIRKLIHQRELDDYVFLTGEMTGTRSVFSALDVVVMGSGTPEPFGGVVIEAMAYGRPVVGTNIGGTAEQVVDGRTGLLVPPNDPGAMARAIAVLLRDPERCRAIGRAARERFLEAFEFAPFYNSMKDIYSRVLKDKKKS
jgi:glycosyltransferase involved in cell wall biosynthesis